MYQYHRPRLIRSRVESDRLEISQEPIGGSESGCLEYNRPHSARGGLKSDCPEYSQKPSGGLDTDREEASKDRCDSADGEQERPRYVFAGRRLLIPQGERSI